MKYTNKWIVIPYSSIDKQIKKNKNITEQILGNKSLSKEEKLASYNNYIVRKLRKTNLPKNQEKDDTNNISINNQESQEEWEDEYSDYDEEDSVDQDFSPIKTPKKEESYYETPMDINNQTVENIQNLSMYKVPAAKNTRSMRKISDKTFMKITENQKVQRKRKIKQIKPPGKQPKSEFGIIKKWDILSKKKK